jgi:hypothetical protein
LEEDAWKKFINSSREEDRLWYNLKKNVAKRQVNHMPWKLLERKWKLNIEKSKMFLANGEIIEKMLH